MAWVDRARRLAVLTGALTRASGPPALLRGIPAFAAIAIAATIAFAGQGMDAADVVAVAGSSLPVRLALWGGWLLVATPITKALLTHPSTHHLRALPVPRWQFLAVQSAHVTLAQAPWMVLWGRGGGAGAAVAAGAGAAAAQALIVARPTSLAGGGAAAALAGAVLAGAEPLVLGITGIAAGAIGVTIAWTRAPERAGSFGGRPGAGRIRSAISGPPALGITLVHLLMLWRSERTALHRGAVAALLGGVVLTLAAANNEVSDTAVLDALTVGIGALTSCIAAGTVAGPILAGERRIGWILDTTATGATARALSAAAATAIPGLGAGLVHGGTAAVLMGRGAGEAARMLALTGALGAAIGVIAASWARRVDREAGVDGTAMVTSMIGTLIGAAILAAVLGAWAVAPLAVLALLLLRTSARRLAWRLKGQWEW